MLNLKANNASEGLNEALAPEPEGLCDLCKALFRELCEMEGHRKPELCQIYEDYVTGEAKTENPEAPLLYAIEVAGQKAFEKADKALRKRGIVG